MLKQAMLLCHCLEIAQLVGVTQLKFHTSLFQPLNTYGGNYW